MLKSKLAGPVPQARARRVCVRRVLGGSARHVRPECVLRVHARSLCPECVSKVDIMFGPLVAPTAVHSSGCASSHTLPTSTSTGADRRAARLQSVCLLACACARARVCVCGGGASWPGSARPESVCGGAASQHVEFRQVQRVHVGPQLVGAGGRDAKAGHFGQLWPSLAKSGPNLAKICQSSANSANMLPIFGPRMGHIWQNSARFGRT